MSVSLSVVGIGSEGEAHSLPQLHPDLSIAGQLVAGQQDPHDRCRLQHSIPLVSNCDVKNYVPNILPVCVSPVLYNAEETFCSLNFASRVRTVELGRASKNVTNGPAGAAGKTAASGAAVPAARKAPG